MFRALLAVMFCSAISFTPMVLGCFLLPAVDEPPANSNVLDNSSTVQWDNSAGAYQHARAYTDYLKKKYGEALKTCDEGEEKIRGVAKIENRDPASYVNLGMIMLLRGTIYYDNGNFDLALAEFKKVVEIRPYDRAGYYNVALTLAQKGEYGEAIKYACKAVELDSTHAESKSLYDWLRNKIIEERRKGKTPAEGEKDGASEPPPSSESNPSGE